MPSVDDVLRIARSTLGEHEDPAGSNRTRFGAEMGMDGVPWCAIWTGYVFRQAGVALPGFSAYTPTYADAFRRAGKAVGRNDGQPGDVIFFAWPSMGRIAHVGIIEKVESPGVYICLEGNGSAKGSRDGGQVVRVRRQGSAIAVIGRPDYSAPASSAPSPGVTYPVLRKGSKGEGVKRWQALLNKITDAGVGVDGDFGPGTDKATRNFQAFFGLEADGIVGARSWSVAIYIEATKG